MFKERGIVEDASHDSRIPSNFNQRQTRVSLKKYFLSYLQCATVAISSFNHHSLDGR